MNILMIAEKGKDLSLLKEYLEAQGEIAVVENTDVLYFSGENYPFGNFDAMIYLGNKVDFVEKAFESANVNKIKRAVLIGSVYSAFDRVYPEKKLAEKHNYVKQANLCAEAAITQGKETSVSVIELPFFENKWPPEFETTRGVIGFNCKRFYFAPDGGTPEITPENAAEAVYAVLNNGENGIKYPVCDKCRKYKDILAENVGEGAKIFVYPEEFAWLTALIKNGELKKAGVAAEFDIKKLYSEFLLENFFFDASEIKKALKLGDNNA